MQNAELQDESWMQPTVAKNKPLPVAEYSDFNPEPSSKSAELLDAERRIRRALIWLAVGIAMILPWLFTVI